MMKMITQFVKQFTGDGNRPGGENRSGMEAGSSGGEHPFRETFASALGKNVGKASVSASRNAPADGQVRKAAASDTPEEGQTSGNAKASGTAEKEAVASGTSETSGSEGKAKEAQPSGTSETSGKAGEVKETSSDKGKAPAVDEGSSSKEGVSAKEGSVSNGTANERSTGEGSSKESAGNEKTDLKKGKSPSSGGEGAVTEARIAGQETAARSAAEQKGGDAGKVSGDVQQSGKETSQSGGTSDKGAHTAKGAAPTSKAAPPGDAGKAPAAQGASGTTKTQEVTVPTQPAEVQKGQEARSGAGEKASGTSKSSPSSQPAQQGRTNGQGGAASSVTKGEVQMQADQPKVVSNGSTQTAEGSGAGQVSSGRAPSQAAQNNAAAAGPAPGRSSSSLFKNSTAGGGTAASSGHNGAGSTSGPASSAGGNAGFTDASPNGTNVTNGSTFEGKTSGQSAAIGPSASGGSTMPGKIPQTSQTKGEGKVTSGPSVPSGARESLSPTGASGRSGTATTEGGGNSAAGVGRTADSTPGKTGNSTDRPAQSSAHVPGSGTVAGEGSESSRQRTIVNGGSDLSDGPSSARGTGGVTAPRSDTQTAAAYQTLNQTEIRTQKEFSPGMGTAAASTVDPATEKMMDLNMGGGQDFTEGEGRNRNEMSRMEALNTSLLQSKSSSRQKLSVHIARAVRQEMKSGGKPDSQWRHHRFVLDDGQSVNVSFRQADGAIQMQLGTGNTELNRLLQQHIDQIRQHLRQELDVDVDLEFQHFGDGESRGEEAPESRSATPGRTDRGDGRATEPVVSDRTGASRGARYLGFNTNEWTA